MMYVIMCMLQTEIKRGHLGREGTVQTHSQGAKQEKRSIWVRREGGGRRRKDEEGICVTIYTG